MAFSEGESDAIKYSAIAAGSLSLAASLIYFAYIIVQTALKDCGLQKRFKYDPEQFDVKEKFINRNLRLQCALQMCIVLGILSDLLIVFFTPSAATQMQFACQFQGVCIQLFNLCIFLYSFVLGLWLLLTVFYGRHMNMWSNTRKRVFEIAGHAFVWFNAILFTGLGFINQSYGQAGLWCWIRNDTDTGRLLQMLLYYVPLWIILILVTIMYIISLIHGKKQCIFIVVVAYRTFSSIRQDVSLVRIGKEVFGKGDVSVATRQVSQEWRVYAKLALWPAIFLIVWIVPTINRIQFLISRTDVFVLTYFHLVIPNLHGLLNVLLFFFNPLNHTVALRKLLCCEYCCKSRQRDDQHVQQNDHMVDGDDETTMEEYGLMKK